MKRIKRLFDYTRLLIKYELLKKEEVETLKKLDRYEIENKTLRMCLKNEEQRTVTFRRNYRNKLNDYEDLLCKFNKVSEEKETLERKQKDGKSRNIQQSKGSARES